MTLGAQWSRLGNAILAKATGKLMWECCCRSCPTFDTLELLEDPTRFVWSNRLATPCIINVALSGLGGCLDGLNGDTAIDAIYENFNALSIEADDGYVICSAEEGTLTDYARRKWGDDTEQAVGLCLAISSSGTGSHYWILSIQSGTALKRWRKAHTIGNLDWSGSYTEWTCSSTGACSTTCANSSGATCVLS
jgi:hypothetical protein